MSEAQAVLSDGQTSARRQRGGGRVWRAGALALSGLAVAGLMATVLFLVLDAEAQSETAWLVPAAAFLAGLLGAGTWRMVADRGRSAGLLAQGLAQTARVGAAVATPRGELLESNAAYDRLFARAGRAPGDPHQVFAANGDDGAAAFRFAQAAAAHGSHCEVVRWLEPGKDGTPCARWLEARVEPLYRSGVSRGRLMLWQFRDVTAEKKRLQERDARLEQMRAWLDADPAARLTVDAAGRITDMNATMRSWLPEAVRDADPLHLSQVFSEASVSLLMARLNGPRNGAVPRTAMLEVLDEAGEIRPLWAGFRTASEKKGVRPKLQITALNGTGAEATEARAESVDGEELFHGAPIAMATVNAKGKIASRNHAFSQTFAIPVQRGNGRLNVLDLVDETAREPLARMIADAAARKPAGAPLDIAFARDEKRAGRLYVVPTPGKRRRGGADAATIYAIDTTEQRALEEQIAQKQKMQEVGQLAGGIAHDFNNLLTGILGYTDLLLSSHRPSDPAFKDIMEVRNNANRAAALVRHLLAYSRRQTLRPKVLSLTDVIEDFGLLLNRLIGEKVTSNIIHARDLWLVKADANQLEQVLMNLAVNARDAMMPEGGELTIRTANVTERDAAKLDRPGLPVGEYVLLEVGDTGCGMSPEVQEKIFEPFFSTKEIGEGTGFGLSVVHGIVKQTGGYIYVDSREGEGTTFSIYLPRHVEEPAEDSAQGEADGADKKRKDLTGQGTILLVEDEEAVRRFAARALESRGYNVLKATTGVEALDVLAEHGREVDLVISDVMMPEMDGPKLLQQMRKTLPDMKVIFISGYAEEALRRELAEDESFTFLPKPFSLKDLASAVKEALAAQ
ncbi:hybrid sensor histidine kinase/response regulator [Dichotomicrobium thermohalophilum]|uniref:histidine kinase n=1 Tax=Dichotomicrobium thermohalophilum TaxID=933063 RepID=A0A397Q386_9HYPH|nr:PAS domain-containing sensor histidine kinase [Dichotomicrobium thermohalophilum]RIA55826.1 two-component system cell cycle sensor histidine kinase/response regulator CckA [Dichotomicrobium thermohalophilum]